MMRRTHLFIIGFLTLLLLGGLSYTLFAQTGTTPQLQRPLPEAIRVHAELLTQEKCVTELGLEEGMSTDEQTALASCVDQEMSVFQGSNDDMRQALVRRILQVAEKRTPLEVGNLFAADPSKANFFYYLTQEDAQVIYHDMVNCYFNIATDTAMEFYLQKATGTSDSDHNADTKISKEEVFDLPKLTPNYCVDVYDSSPLINKLYEKRMTAFQEALLTSVRESKNTQQDVGFTALIGKFALEDMEHYFQYLGFIGGHPDNTHFAPGGFPLFVYRVTDLNQSNVFGTIHLTAQERLAEYDRAEHNLKAALRAYQNFEHTFPIHMQYKKLQYVSDAIRRKIQGVRLAWKFLNVKFDNASIEGGAK